MKKTQQSNHHITALLALGILFATALVMITGSVLVRESQDVRKDAALTPGSL